MICLNAYGKINWTLDILGRREDGYHLMDMLLQSVSLADTLRLEESDELRLSVSGGGGAGSKRDGLSSAAVPGDESNLVCRAAKALAGYGGLQPRAAMRLEKRIPSGAGMGGGSADAAAALLGLNLLWKLGLSLDELEKIGLSLGADIPFMLRGGLARVGGVGERLRSLSPPPEIWLVLCQPCDGLSTREIFSAYDRQPGKASAPDNETAQSALLRRDLPALGKSMNNVLEPISLLSRPAMGVAIRELERLGAIRAMMTGSGSVIYGMFGSRLEAQSAVDQWSLPGASPFLASTRAQGVELCP